MNPSPALPFTDLRPGDDAAQVAALPAVRAVLDAYEPALPGVAGRAVAEVSGDDDTDAELDVIGGDEPAWVDDERFYADALEVLR